MNLFLKKIGPAKLPVIVLFSLLLSGSLLRFIKLGHESMWFDELWNIWAGKLPLGRIVPEIMAGGHPPAYTLIVHFWHLPVGSEAWARALPAIFGITTLVFVFLLGRKLFSRSAGLWAVALAAFCPLMVWYSRDATSYSWVTMVTVISFYFLTQSSLEGGWLFWGGYIVAASLLVMSSFFAIIAIIAGIGFFLLMRDVNRGMTKWIIVNSILLAELLIFFGLDHFFIARANYSYVVPPLFRIVELMVIVPSTFIRGYTGAGDAMQPLTLSMATGAFIILALFFVFFAAMNIKRADSGLFRRRFLSLSVYTLIAIVGTSIAQIAAGGYYLSGRYYVWAAPAFVLVLAAVIAWSPSKMKVATGVALAFAMLIFTGFDLSGSHDTDWRSAMSTVAANEQEGDGLLCFPLNECTVAAAFYLERPVPVIGGWLTDEGVMFQEAGDYWDGYDRETRAVTVAGAGLKDKITSDSSGFSRMWLVREGGPESSVTELVDELPPNWRSDKYWRLGQFTVNLYDHAP